MYGLSTLLPCTPYAVDRVDYPVSPLLLLCYEVEAIPDLERETAARSLPLASY